MCELFGVSSKKKIYVNDYLKEFFRHSDVHRNGWGIAQFYGNSVSVEKEPVRALDSSYLKQRLKQRLEVDAMFAHIRLATVGTMDYVNCHPFSRRDSHDRCWTLIHNGTIFDYSRINQYLFQQEGGTDSERILYFFVDKLDQQMKHLGRDLTPGERFALLDELVVDMAPGNKLNLLLYDGELMYVHSNMQHTLHVLQYPECAVFATAPLSQEDWKPVPCMQLLAFRDGVLIYEGTKHSGEYVEKPNDLKYFYATYSSL